MFEKEAKEYSTSSKIDYVNNIAITLVEQAYKDGAEFGYNKAKIEVEESYKESLYNEEMNLTSVTERLEELEKANEWHDLRKNPNDLPKECGNVFINALDYGINTCYVAHRLNGKWWSNCSSKIFVRVIKWKEIVLP